MLQSQGDVVGGDGEEALQLRVCIQVGSVGLQEGPQGARTHVLHDEDVRLCVMRGRTHTQCGFIIASCREGQWFQGEFPACRGCQSVFEGVSPSAVFQSSNWRTFLWCTSFLMMEISVSTCLWRTPQDKKKKEKMRKMT